MLSKLFRYEVKAVGRVMLPLYGAAFVSALVLGLTTFFNENLINMDLPIAIIALLYSMILIAIVIMTGVLSVTRFYNNLLGTEGYLMFSLPAGTPALIAAKVLAAIFWSFVSVLAGILSALVFALTYALPHFNADTMLQLRRMFEEILQHLRIEHIQGIGAFLLLLLAGVCALAGFLTRIYAALAVGHQWSGHRILGAVLAYMGLGIAENWIRILLARIGFNTYLPFLLDKFDGSTISGMTLGSLSSIGISLVTILIYGLITDVLLDRRLNLE